MATLRAKLDRLHHRPTRDETPTFDRSGTTEQNGEAAPPTQVAPTTTPLAPTPEAPAPSALAAAPPQAAAPPTPPQPAGARAPAPSRSAASRRASGKTAGDAPDPPPTRPSRVVVDGQGMRAEYAVREGTSAALSARAFQSWKANREAAVAPRPVLESVPSFASMLPAAAPTPPSFPNTADPVAEPARSTSGPARSAVSAPRSTPRESRAPAPSPRSQTNAGAPQVVVAETLLSGTPRDPCGHLSEVLRGRFVQTALGGAFAVQDTTPLAASLGQSVLAEGVLETGFFAEWLQDPRLGRVDTRRAMFLDLETTGLSGATDLAFLIGLAWLHGDDVRTQIWAAHTAQDEAAALAAALQSLARADVLITFNGTTFDLPFLRRRLARAGLATDVLDRPHLDLLVAARRLPKGSLPSRRLAALEGEVLGFHRHDDLPGREAPARFHRAQQTGDWRPWIPIVEHNRLDLLAMVPLTARLAERAGWRQTTGNTFSRDADDLARQALLQLQDLDTPQAAAALLRAAWQAGSTQQAVGPDWRRAMPALARLHEQSGQPALAAEVWEALLRHAPQDPLPHSALCQLYDTQLGDPARALRHAERALALQPYHDGLRRVRKRLGG